MNWKVSQFIDVWHVASRNQNCNLSGDGWQCTCNIVWVKNSMPRSTFEFIHQSAFHALSSQWMTLRRNYSNGLWSREWEIEMTITFLHKFVINALHIFIHKKYFSSVLSSSFTHPEPHGWQHLTLFSLSVCAGFTLHNLLDHNGTSSPLFNARVA